MRPIICVLACVLVAAGCGGSDPAFVGDSGQFAIGPTRVHYYTGGGRVFLAVWHDYVVGTEQTGSMSYGGVGSSADRTTIDGEFVSGDESRKLTWRCRTRDGSAGEVRIDDLRFDLAQGNVFLVHAAPGGPEVTQLAVPIAAARPLEPAFLALADTLPAVGGFLRAAATSSAARSGSTGAPG
jgi:hypothetical protein